LFLVIKTNKQTRKRKEKKKQQQQQQQKTSLFEHFEVYALSSKKNAIKRNAKTR